MYLLDMKKKLNLEKKNPPKPKRNPSPSVTTAQVIKL